MKNNKEEIALTYYPTDYFITEENKDNYRKNPKVCVSCEKKIEELFELEFIDTSSPRDPKKIEHLPIHKDCKYNQQKGIILGIQ